MLKIENKKMKGIFVRRRTGVGGGGDIDIIEFITASVSVIFLPLDFTS